MVPYTEYLLFRQPDKSIALLNIGGIGNITILPANCKPEEVLAFDTGVGNMVIDALVFHYSHNSLRYDEGGAWAQRGTVDASFLAWMEYSDSYLPLSLPKSTGRELYGKAYVQRLLKQADSRQLNCSDVLATATYFIARSVKRGVQRFYHGNLDYLVVGGGGSHNQLSWMLCSRSWEFLFSPGRISDVTATARRLLPSPFWLGNGLQESRIP